VRSGMTGSRGKVEYAFPSRSRGRARASRYRIIKQFGAEEVFIRPIRFIN
jgi:hypothetical protein